MTLAYEATGHGAVLVLLHAFPLARAMWKPQVAALSDVCRIITPDLPGFGESALPDGTPGVEGMADAVAELLDTLAIREPVILGGLSMGGYVAFAFQRRHPGRLRGLLLCDTRTEADDDAGKANRDKLIGFAATNPASAVIEQMLPKVLGPKTLSSRPEVVDTVKRLGSAQRPAGIIAGLQALRNRPDSTPTLATIRVPTLFVVGRDDALTPPAASEAMAAKVPGSRLVVLEGAGHLSNLETPEAFNAAVREFVGEV